MADNFANQKLRIVLPYRFWWIKIFLYYHIKSDNIQMQSTIGYSYHIDGDQLLTSEVFSL